MTAKIRTNITLTEEGREILERYAKRHGCSLSMAVELAVRRLSDATCTQSTATTRGDGNPMIGG